MKTIYRNTIFIPKFIVAIAAWLFSISVSAQQENIYFVQAMKQFKECNYKGAAQEFSNAIDYDANTGEAYAYRARCAIFLGDFDNAKADLAQADALIKGTNAQLMLSYGYLYNEMKDYKKAIQYLDEAVKTDAKLAEAYNARGFSYQSLGKHKEALDDYTEAIKADNKYAIAYNNHGAAIYYNQDIAKASKWDLKNALYDFNKALDLDTSFCIAHRNKALVLKLMRQEGEALTEINTAIHCDPDNADNYLTRGSIKLEVKAPADAIADYNKALELNPNFAQAYIEIARAKALLKRYDEAFADLDHALELNENLKARVFYNKAMVSALKGKKDDMIHYLNQAKRLGMFDNKLAITQFKEDDGFTDFRRHPEFLKFMNKLR